MSELVLINFQTEEIKRDYFQQIMQALKKTQKEIFNEMIDEFILSNKNLLVDSHIGKFDETLFKNGHTNQDVGSAAVELNRQV